MSQSICCLPCIQQNLIEDATLLAFQLNLEVAMVGERPSDEATNWGILQGTASTDVHNNYREVSRESFIQALRSNNQMHLDDHRSRCYGSMRRHQQDMELDMEVMGPELQVILVRRKEGEKCETVLRLGHATSINDLKEEVTALVSTSEPLDGIAYRSVVFPALQDLIASTVVHVNQEALTTVQALPPAAIMDQQCSADSSVVLLCRQLSTQQARLLSSSAVLQSSTLTLHEINGLLLVPPDSVGTVSLPTSLLSPFSQLTSLFATTVEAPCQNPWCSLPPLLQELHLTAGTTEQSFSASAIWDLVQLRRLTLKGYAELDLTAMPAVRPGFTLSVNEPCLSRTSPLGSSTYDKLMPSGVQYLRKWDANHLVGNQLMGMPDLSDLKICLSDTHTANGMDLLFTVMAQMDDVTAEWEVHWHLTNSEGGDVTAEWEVHWHLTNSEVGDVRAEWEVHWHLTNSEVGDVSLEHLSQGNDEAEGGGGQPLTNDRTRLHSVCLSFQRKH
ncbi:hypothetical protein CEUSTIGMA_g4597.t1 [Chlamydomonas eustigma]|uniref:Uncharacterized protein n=1 Tax=Chlamydomonas eustigma TaxID=1157962 RepID=A0A250X2N1_9CHLO|nr:hypothetical protein CEUSTIGMA_g4597.t1 [Chlamydomonas eustigma]|eukprot:GAX77152.1 hypothetical protein CEUSTIGMA_g4597.t1 [Chlamydomonas eustigma]